MLSDPPSLNDASVFVIVDRGYFAEVDPNEREAKIEFCEKQELLTPCDLKILYRLKDKHTIQQIARELNLTPKNVVDRALKAGHKIQRAIAELPSYRIH